MRHMNKTLAPWMLIALLAAPLTAHAEDFRTFVWRFFNDPEFQISRVEFPIAVVTVEDDPVKVLVAKEKKLLKSEWKHLPGPEHFRCKKSCYDIVFYDNFDRKFRDSSERIIAFEGVNNGINSALFFRHKDGKWMLVKWDDQSN